MERLTCVLWSIVTWRDLRRPQPGHRYSDCFLGLAFFNLDPSIHFSDLKRPSASPTWALVLWLLLGSCFLESWSIYPLLGLAVLSLDPSIHFFLVLRSLDLLLGLVLFGSWATNVACLRCTAFFPVFCFNLFSQSNLLKDFHCSFPAFFFLLSSW